MCKIFIDQSFFKTATTFQNALESYLYATSENAGKFGLHHKLLARHLSCSLKSTSLGRIFVG